ncbi:MAG: recombination regulator RecX [Chloroflexi bacterium]|nr:recombination regulator RecX [Chloroflexota bacterium]
MRITALRRARRSSTGVLVDIDGVFACVLSQLAVAQLHLVEGSELTDDDRVSILTVAAREQALDRAMSLLAARPRSVQEVEQRLRFLKFDTAVISATIAKLRDLGVLDDRSFAHFWREERDTYRPHGRQLLNQELRARGVAPDTVAEVLPSEEEELELARRSLARRLGRFQGESWQEFQHVFYPFLARRGFSHEVIQRTLRETWRKQQCEPES